jgi:Ni/Fe-hydrogenase subunit HybB-like protein
VNRAGQIALITIGPLAVGACALLLLVAAAVKLFSKDEQRLAPMAVDAAITIAVGAALIVGICQLAL